MKVRVTLTTPDRMRFVCWLVGHRWTVRPDDPTQLECARCRALGRLEA